MLLTAYEIRLALGGPWVGGLALGGPWVGRWEDLGRWFEEASKRKEAFGQVRLLRGYPLIAFYLAAAPTISILQPRLRLRPRLICLGFCVPIWVPSSTNSAAPPLRPSCSCGVAAAPPPPRLICHGFNSAAPLVLHCAPARLLTWAYE